MLSFIELKTEISKLVQRSDDSKYIAKIGTWVNLGQEFLANIYDYYNELEEIHNFNTADGTEDYFMPNDLDKPLRLYDLTNDKPVKPKTEVEYFDANISNIADASEETAPAFYRIYGVSGIKASISSSGDTFKIKSSSSTETAEVIIRIEGFIDSSKTIIDYENITIPTTGSSTYVSGSKTFYKITHVSKSINTDGYISVANSSNTVVAIIASWERVLKHKVLKLGLIPNKINSMRLLYKRKVRRLVHDNDYPFTDADDYLMLEAQGYALTEEKETVERGFVSWKKAKECLDKILINKQSKLGPDFQQKFESTWLQAHRIR